jgi:hypothetical protein
MKSKFLFFLLSLILIGTVNSAVAQAKLDISFQALNTIEGFDHVSRMHVFIDGKEIVQSTEMKQSEKNIVSLDVKPGKHDVKCVLWANYPGEGWIERTYENDFSFDWLFEKNMKLKKGKNKLNIVFNIKDNSVSEKK